MPEEAQAFFKLFPVIFIGGWLGITTLLAVLSGWFGLMKKYPNRQQAVCIRKFSGVSAGMGIGVNNNRIMIIEICREGMRVGVSRIFAPFVRPFFVPWEKIEVQRRKLLGILPSVEVIFEHSKFYRMTFRPTDANAFWRAAADLWPEKGVPPAPPSFWKVWRGYLLMAGGLCIFFYLMIFFVIPGQEKMKDPPPADFIFGLPLFLGSVMTALAFFEFRRNRA